MCSNKDQSLQSQHKWRDEASRWMILPRIEKILVCVFFFFRVVRYRSKRKIILACDSWRSDCVCLRCWMYSWSPGDESCSVLTDEINIRNLYAIFRLSCFFFSHFPWSSLFFPSLTDKVSLPVWFLSGRATKRHSCPLAALWTRYRRHDQHARSQHLLHPPFMFSYCQMGSSTLNTCTDRDLSVPPPPPPIDGPHSNLLKGKGESMWPRCFACLLVVYLCACDLLTPSVWVSSDHLILLTGRRRRGSGWGWGCRGVRGTGEEGRRGMPRRVMGWRRKWQ